MKDKPLSEQIAELKVRKHKDTIGDELAQQIIDLCHPSWMSFNKLELEAEELESAHMHLDRMNIPRHSEKDVEYSIVGRINVAIRLIRSLNEGTA